MRYSLGVLVLISVVEWGCFWTGMALSCVSITWAAAVVGTAATTVFQTRALRKERLRRLPSRPDRAERRAAVEAVDQGVPPAHPGTAETAARYAWTVVYARSPRFYLLWQPAALAVVGTVLAVLVTPWLLVPAAVLAVASAGLGLHARRVHPVAQRYLTLPGPAAQQWTDRPVGPVTPA
jgi:hypothetical protein